jgi:hypothetical protein
MSPTATMEAEMKNLIATLLGVIAAGVMLIAFELMPARTAPGSMDVTGQAIGLARPVNIGVDENQAPYPYYGDRLARPMPVAYSPYDAAPARVVRAVPQPVSYSTAPRSTTTRRIEQPGRDWGKTAMVIGGTSAAGAGLGAIFGGKKGALIGAAIGGGAGTLYEVKKGR